MAKVIIVGGGASGLIAAISAARYGADVTILERLNRVGKKILATGNGRCNISNKYSTIERYHGENSNFINNAFSTFTVEDTINFFEEIGVHLKEESEGKLYPYSDQASSVLDVLRFEVERLGIKEICDREVTKIRKKNNKFIVNTKEKEDFTCDRLILATGGMAAPNLGSNGSGYEIAKDLGHSVTTLFPALVQMKLDAKFLKSVKGVKFIGSCTALSNGNAIRTECGEILFTDYGISGPPILQLSRKIAESLKQKNTTELMVDMMEQYSEEELDEILVKRLLSMSYKTVEESLIGLINKRLIIPYLNLAEIDKAKKCAHISKKERKRLNQVLKNLTLTVNGTKSWNNAQVTAGGIKTNEINPKTMESKIVKDLYITGELLDIDGDCGGFNLQWAWSSGYIAGCNAAK